MGFRISCETVYQAVSLTVRPPELAFQAEYAGSIPLIGSTSTRVNSRTGCHRRGGGPLPVPYTASWHRQLRCDRLAERLLALHDLVGEGELAVPRAHGYGHVRPVSGTHPSRSSGPG